MLLKTTVLVRQLHQQASLYASTSSSRCAWCQTRSASSSAAPSVAQRHNRSATLPPPQADLSDVLDNPELVKSNLRDRKFPLDLGKVDELREMELEAVSLRKQLQDLRQRRNVVASLPKTDLDARKQGAEIKQLLKQLEPKLQQLNQAIQTIANQLPNLSHPKSPIGSEDFATLVKTIGPSVDLNNESDRNRDHLGLTSPPNLGWTDFASSTVTTGSSWPLLTSSGAILELALVNYAISTVLSSDVGFKPVLTPDVVRTDIADRCGFKPRDGEAQQTYFLSDGSGTSKGESGLCLVGTAEIPLVAMSAGQTFQQPDLPKKFIALGRAFRAEAGARGADSRGLYRVHQFSKVEMVVLCTEEQSDDMLEQLRTIQERLLGDLGLSLRVLDMPTEELGASAHRKYDIEAWMPGRGKWGELSSASNCTTYQARRLSIRYRPTVASFDRLDKPPLEDLDIPTPAALEATALYPPQTGSAQFASAKLKYVHTLNATAAAVPRLIVALVENGVVLDQAGKVDKVRLPKVLEKFWLGPVDPVIEWVPTGESLKK
ncbi:Serine--tRNA ligase, mitochondrial [Microbotryomycetes sp. JL201]|nr:Serine--tRNA ligase, mitochondrial [Microbotryomycetes sp. JL201]